MHAANEISRSHLLLNSVMLFILNPLEHHLCIALMRCPSLPWYLFAMSREGVVPLALPLCGALSPYVVPRCLSAGHSFIRVLVNYSWAHCPSYALLLCCNYVILTVVIIELRRLLCVKCIAHIVYSERRL